jgi:glycosyltransferase involved in cell wall biosynthesis
MAKKRAPKRAPRAREKHPTVTAKADTTDWAKVIPGETPADWNADRAYHTPAPGAPRVTILIPTHNEARRVHATLAQIATFLHRPETGRWNFDVLVMDDGTDSTASDCEGAATALNLPLRVIHSNRRLGKGGAVAQGIREAKGEIVVMYDADASTAPKEIPRLLEPLYAHFGKTRADISVGSRHAPGAKIGGVRKPTRQFASRGFRALTKSLFGLPLRDTQCGFKAFRKTPAFMRVVNETLATGFEWDVEILARAHRAGLPIAEVPIEWQDKAGSTVTPRDVWRMLNGIVAIHRRLKRKN